MTKKKNSSKPDRVRDLIAMWYPDKPKLEMFARPATEMWPKHPGWATWGNELPNDVAMTPNIKAEPPPVSGGEAQKEHPNE